MSYRYKTGRGSASFWEASAVAARFWGKVEKIPFHTCWEWTGGRYINGYGNFPSRARLSKGDCGNDYAHRVAWRLSNGPIPDGLHVLHKCDNRSCVNPDHLFLGTNTANVHDMRSKGRTRLFGVVLPADRGLKLTAKEAKEIYARRHNGESLRGLAREFSVEINTIFSIEKGRIWGRITGAGSEEVVHD